MSGEWRLRAACTTWHPDAPYASEGSPEEEVFIRKACGECEVRKACLEWALRFDDPGVIGGLNQTQRRAVQDEQASRRSKPAQWRPSGCGTGGGYFRHRRAGEKPCDACRTAHSARDAANEQRRRARERLVPRQPPEDTGACGTGKGYQRHHARGQEACEPCTAAKTEQSRQCKTKAG